MSENINFIPANELPELEAETVDVLAVDPETGEMGKKSVASLGSGGGFMEVEIVLSSDNFYSGTATFSKTYDEIKAALDSGCFVIGWVKTAQFTGEEHNYSPGCMRPAFPKYVPDFNEGTIFFISSNENMASISIRSDGTTDVYFD